VEGKLSRRELLQRAGVAALGTAGFYSLVDELAAAPARAAVAAAAALPEQHLLRGQAVIVDNGVRVLVPPLHHQIVTGRLTVARRRPALLDAQRTLAEALRVLERRYRPTPGGLSMTVAWGLPYFRELVPRLRDGRGYPEYLPVDTAASQAAGEPVPAVLDAIRFASDPQGLRLEENHVCFKFQSDSLAHVQDGAQSLADALSGMLRITSVRQGFVGGGFDGTRSLPKELATRARIPGAELIPPTAQLFLGFTSSQAAGLGPDRIANFETLPGLTDQWPNGYFRNGTTLHLSHLFEDVERWYTEFGFANRIWRMTDAARAAELVPTGTTTLPVAVRDVESQAEVAQFATDEETGLVGHSASMHPVNRLPRALRDNYGVRRPRGTAILQRVDFNTLDNPFFWSSRPSADRMRDGAAAGLHFAAFSPTSDIFHRMRAAMDGRYADGTVLPMSPRSTGLGLNSVIEATHRQNYLVPPRRHASFPLAELAAP